MTTWNDREERARQALALAKEAKRNARLAGPKLRRVFVKFTTRHGEQREYLWAHEVGAEAVRIANIPFCTETVGCDDLVRVSRSGEVAEVLQRATRTRHARFEPANDPKKARQQWRLIEKHLASRNVQCEVAWPGVFGMAVPLGLDDAAFLEHVGRCKVPLALLDQSGAVNLWIEHANRIRRASGRPGAEGCRDDDAALTWRKNPDGSFTGSDGSELLLYSQRAIIHDSGPHEASGEEWRRAEKLDFSAPAIPQPACQCCGRRFREFRLPEAVWRMLPEHYRGVLLCEDDLLRLLREVGHDTARIQIDRTVWNWKVAKWEDSRAFPPRYAHLYLGMREVLWCEVVWRTGDGTFLVRLIDSPLFSGALKRGTCLLARWNGTRRHGITGRAVFKPLSECSGEASSHNATPAGNPGIFDRTRSWRSVEELQRDLGGWDEGQGYRVKLTSTKARLNDLEAVCRVLDGYTLGSDITVRLGQEDGACTLELLGEDWPLVWKNEPEPTPEELPGVTARYAGMNPDELAEKHARGFFDLLRELAPYLETGILQS